MEHAFDNGFVENRLGGVQAGHGRFEVALLNVGENLFQLGLAASLPKTVVKTVSLRSTDALDSGLLIGHFIHLLGLNSKHSTTLCGLFATYE